MHVVGKTETTLGAKHNYSIVRTREYIKRFLLMPVQKVHATGFYGYWLLKEDAVQRPLRMLPASPWRLSNVLSSIVQCPMCIVQYSLSNGQCAICIVQVVELRGVGHLSKSPRRWCAAP